MANVKRIIFTLFIALLVLLAMAMIWARFFRIETTPFMSSQERQLGEIAQQWVDTDELPIFIKTSIMAGEDAGFCAHNGVEWAILWQLTKEGGKRGGSTISQQMVKNLWLWHGQNWFARAFRKLIEIPLTLLVELTFPKARIMELYLNIVEFDEGVFGIEAASWHHFGHGADHLTREEMSRLAAVLPNPAAFQAVPPDAYVRKRAPIIARGARDIEALDLARCVE